MAKHLGDMTITWDHTKKDFKVEYPQDERDGQLVVDNVLSEDFLEELQARGFDLTSLHFVVRLHGSKGGRPGASQMALPPAANPATRAPVPRVTKDGIVIPVQRIPGQVQGRLPGARR